MRKHGLKVLGLALMAAVGLMAFSATSALAVTELKLGDKFYENNETPPEFLIEPSAGVHTLSPTGLTTQVIKATQIGSGRFAIPNKKAEIVCKKGEITATAANEYEDFSVTAMKAGAHASATIKAKECTTEEINEKHELTGKFPKCIPNYDTTPGEIEAKVLFLGKKHEGVPYIVAVAPVTSVEPAKKIKENEELKSAFTKVKFDVENCLLPTSTITGSASFKTPTTDAIKPILKINTLGGDKLIGTGLKFGASEAFIEVEAEAELEGKNEKWGVM